MAVDSNRLVCVGKISKAHGIKGFVKVHSYTGDPADITSYGPLYSKDGGRHFSMRIVSSSSEQLVAHIDGVEDRNQAEQLRGTELYIPREALPEPNDGEFYYVDLIGFDVLLSTDRSYYGRVNNFYNYGAGDIVEIVRSADQKEELLAFDTQTIPEVNLDEGYVVVTLPEKEFVNANDNVAPDANED